MSPAGRQRSAAGQMLACYFSRRPFDAGRPGCGWARGMMPPVDQDAADLVARYRQISTEISTPPDAARTPEDRLTLTYHESVPGHHIEMSRNQEAGIASPFRQLISILPYREGWALHMERVADELGLLSRRGQNMPTPGTGG